MIAHLWMPARYIGRHPGRFLPLVSSQVDTHINGSAGRSHKNQGSNGNMHFPGHIIIKKVHIFFIGFIGIAVHILQRLIQQFINHCAAETVLRLTAGAQPGIYLAVAFPVPVVQKQHAVSLRLIVAKQMLIVKIIGIHHYILIRIQVSQLFLIALRIFLQRLIQRHQYNIAACLRLSFGNQPAQAVLFFIRQLIRIIENPFLRHRLRIAPLCRLFPGPGKLQRRKNHSEDKYNYKIHPEIFQIPFHPTVPPVFPSKAAKSVTCRRKKYRRRQKFS